MKRDELVTWLDDYLAIRDYDDISLNGLQVEGRDEVSKVAVAVDSSVTTFEQAAQTGADMLIVHHGLFWGKPLAVTGMHKKRLAYLLEHDISLYAAHIPLDAHREVGNNWGLARILGMSDLEDFGTWKGKPVGVKGTFPNKVSLRDLADLTEKELGESVLVHAGGDLEIGSLGIISGGAAWDVVTAADEGTGRLFDRRTQTRGFLRGVRTGHQRPIRRALHDRDGRREFTRRQTARRIRGGDGVYFVADGTLRAHRSPLTVALCPVGPPLKKGRL